MVQFLPQAQIRAPRNIGIDPRGLADLGQAAQQFGLARQEAATQETRQRTLAEIAQLAQAGAPTEQIASTLIASGDNQLATLGARTLIAERSRAASQANKPPRIMQDVAGRPRFVDDGSLVFPEAKPDPVKRFGKPPSGFRFTDTGTLEIIPGGPEDRKEQERQQQQEARKGQKDTAATVVIQDIDRTIKKVEDSPNLTTGLGGQVLSNVGGTEAANVSSLLTTIKANAGFDRLQAMREASPTGGALGQVSNLELGQLNAAIGALEQSQGAGQLQDNLRRVKNIYLDIIHGPGGGPAREPLQFQQPQQQADNRPALVPQDAPKLEAGQSVTLPNGVTIRRRN